MHNRYGCRAKLNNHGVELQCLASGGLYNQLTLIIMYDKPRGNIHVLYAVKATDNLQCNAMKLFICFWYCATSV